MTTKRNDPLTLHKDYNLLGLADLLDARDKNQADLMRRENVVATAVGLYLIRRTDPWPPTAPPDERGKRTLANSEVRPYSWPCIIVFVERWREESQLHWEDMVPSALYLDDRRKVPVCVVEAPRLETALPSPRTIVFPSNRLGGGLPLIAEVQGREYVASIGCLVTDGHTTYALTNRHVTGEPGEAVYTKIGGERMRVGQSAALQLTRLPFQEVYPGWAGKHTYLNLDVGLVRVDDVSRWSAQVFQLGTMGEIADLATDNMSLRLIDCPVRAYGCASGLMRGAIKALFYRYRYRGGFEYVSDFLIGALDEQTDFATHPGDSGTVWMLETDARGLRPIALQWGGQLFDAAGAAQPVSFALATCLSTVCHRLALDVVRDWNLGETEYWGEVGHYTIGALACTLDFHDLPGLRQLMSTNMDRVGFTVGDLKKSEKVLINQAHYEYVPLADVADDVWRTTRPSDENNHFADMDEPATSGPYTGKTLLELTAHGGSIDPKVWLEFYKGTPGTNPGALPFRVWQIYEAMVGYARGHDAVGFLTAAGCLAHYVGDACQPLHVSRLHHGLPPVKKGTVAYDVHSVYETTMLNNHAPALVDGVVAKLAGHSAKASFTGGRGAARHVIALMRQTVKTLPPRTIVDAYNAEHSPSARATRLWTDFGPRTIEVMAAGCICLAEIWASAWAEGSGEAIAKAELGHKEWPDLAVLYRNKDFLPSFGLSHLADLLHHDGHEKS